MPQFVHLDCGTKCDDANKRCIWHQRQRLLHCCPEPHNLFRGQRGVQHEQECRRAPRGYGAGWGMAGQAVLQSCVRGVQLRGLRLRRDALVTWGEPVSFVAQRAQPHEGLVVHTSIRAQHRRTAATHDWIIIDQRHVGQSPQRCDRNGEWHHQLCCIHSAAWPHVPHKSHALRLLLLRDVHVAPAPAAERSRAVGAALNAGMECAGRH
mmetsp:Transcript_12654/g.38145  ORF Transcript_12654/g.38145 Transcript_12654/m.38145 type:complete len:208 (+) Transcript_12654:3728-4351(+)